MEQWGRPA